MNFFGVTQCVTAAIKVIHHPADFVTLAVDLSLQHQTLKCRATDQATEFDALGVRTSWTFMNV